MNRLKFAAAAFITQFLTGCLVLDQVTTITVRPDGTSQLVVFHSNVRSTEEGPKGVEEVNRYADQFDARSSDDFTRIRDAGGTVIDATWLQREAPYSTMVAARFGTADSLMKYFSIEAGDDATRLTSRFSRAGTRRRISMVLLPPKGFDPSNLAAESLKDAREQAANGISEVRMIVADGQITAAQGWTVASDKRSALLALDEIEQLLRTNPSQIELFIEWEVKQ